MGKTVQILYGKSTLKLQIPDGNPLRILASEGLSSSDAPDRILRRALSNPIGSLGLDDLTKDVRKILIITNDNTRPMPSKVTIPAMIDSFHSPADQYEITILIATGLHRPMTDEEMLEQFGSDLCGRYKIVNHIARDKDSLTSFGKLQSGNELYLNKLVAESDLVIAEGFIESHFFAGFSGGRKSILPGVAGESSILANHKPENIASPMSRQSNLTDNPIHDECLEAARLSGLAFILNVALDKEKQIIAAFAGDPVEAHLAGCRFVKDTMSVDAQPADISITSNNGYPLDRNLYQVVKGIDTASAVTKERGVIIAVARCADGVGHERFRDLILSCASITELCEKMSASPSEIDKWQAQVLAKALTRHKIILVSEGIDRKLAERMFFIYADMIGEALDLALAEVGLDASINVLPEGPVIIPRITQ
ncbi:MAG: nickel-dependent lactate racemase [Peptococcaceae bacterium]|jgi:nickel-dependent lactate racemase|nr:nickel-dependent lactate racemase [Peptococcaceae bacterium]